MAYSEFGHVSVELLDKLGVVTACPIYIEADPTKTLAQLTTDITSLCTAIDAASDSEIQGVTLKLSVPVNRTGWKVAPAATAENERTGLFNFSQAVGPYKFGVDIPSIADSLISAGKIDLTLSAITGLVAALNVPYTGFQVVSTAIQALTVLTDALLTFRKHRKAENRRSFEVG